MRDAISILDQAVSGAPSRHIEKDAVLSMLGRPDMKRIGELVHAITTLDRKSALGIYRGLVSDGADPVQIMDDIAEMTHLAGLYLIDPELASVTGTEDDARETVAGIAGEAPGASFMSATRMLLETRPQITDGANRIQAGEVLVMRLVLGFQKARKATGKTGSRAA